MGSKKTIQEEKPLVSSCIQGDKVAWNKLVEQYKGLIHKSISRTLQLKGWRTDLHLIEELYQDFFLKLHEDNYKKLRQFGWRHNCSLATWLWAIARNFVLDFVRKGSRKVYKTQSLDKRPDSDEGEDYSDEEEEDKSKNALENLIEQESRDLLGKAMESLPKEEATLIDLIYFEKIPHERVARMMGKSVDALYIQKKRVLEKLKKYFEKHVGIEDLERLLL